MKTNLIQLVLLLILSNSVLANVTLPTIFSDNMVLQRNDDVKLWGWANPGEEVQLITSWNNKKYTIKADNQANWSLKIATPEAGGPYTITLKGNNEVTLKNILIGEVWLCSGQSNMEMTPAWGIKNGDAEVQRAINPTIRFFTVGKQSAQYPQNNLSGTWVDCTPETMKNFSAVAYFFGKRVQENLKNVPIGLISSSWGGTPAEIWIPENTITQEPGLLNAAKQLTASQYGPIEPGRAFNAMIQPLVGFAIAGAIWYQGESNVGATNYDSTLSALISSWRKLWNDDFPFYLVQIAPFKYGEDNFGGVIIRDAQRKLVDKVPNTGMVITSDISTIDDIHPKDKKSVGIRLGNLALAKTYQKKINWVNGPIFKNIKITRNKVLVNFVYASGLHFYTKKSDLFEVAGEDGIFYTANATIKNNAVVLYSSKVKNPVRVRYAWGNTVQSDLFNKVNLPASSFITD